ncbi:hypothetical protein LITTLEE_163 [Mycobacterium phage LittleE]|uniref:Uncharacterized protein n=1 Tax=Mycobacterium phage LittleE TaxID=2922212 RepID=G1D448_9CAUD|nr:hypothetical protein FGG27_gp163 [Mycobacterium phage LittleE]AEK09543.1 hypothetical protein LITTLEE_163 [Mycobacterium phage LittleE]
MSYALRVRKARTVRYGCHVIQPGEFYIDHTEFPGGDAGYADTAGHPVRMAECRVCAERYGRGDLIKDRESS